MKDDYMSPSFNSYEKGSRKPTPNSVDYTLFVDNIPVSLTQVLPLLYCCLHFISFVNILGRFEVSFYGLWHLAKSVSC